jgi:hypothetical protein
MAAAGNEGKVGRALERGTAGTAVKIESCLDRATLFNLSPAQPGILEAGISNFLWENLKEHGRAKEELLLVFDKSISQLDIF